MNDLKRIINKIIDLIKDNKNLLKKLNQEDNEIFEVDFNADRLIEIFVKYKSEIIKSVDKKKILINHYGNPYITAMLCIEGIINKTELIIGIEDICYGLNKAIIKIIKDSLKECKINFSIELRNNLTCADIKKENLDKIICLGNSNSYTNFKKFQKSKVEYVPLYDINLYYDSDEYAELAENIRCYAIANFYEIEIFDETEEIEDVIYMIKHSFSKYCSTILSRDKEKQKMFKQELNSEIICINENPFNKFELKIPKQIWGRGRA